MAKLPSYLKDNAERIRQFEAKCIIWEKAYDPFQKTNALVKTIYKQYPERTLCRSDIVKLMATGELHLGLVAAMMWGGITAASLKKLLGMGNARLAAIVRQAERYLTNGQIQEAVHYLEHEGKLSGIGHPYYSKILFFLAQANPDITAQPLIFDRWTKNAFYVFLNQTGQKAAADEYFQNKLIGDSVEVKGSKLPVAYDAFVRNMDNWAKQLSVSPAKLDEFVFGDGRNTKAGRAANNPRIELLALLHKIYSENHH